MNDPTEVDRRSLQAEINADPSTPEEPSWTTDEMTAVYEVEGFLAPYVIVRRRADGVSGTLMFRHSPRIYFGWSPDTR